MENKTVRELILSFYKEVFQNRDLSEIDKYMHDSYIQHNAEVKNGKFGFLEFAESFLALEPRFDIVKLICEDDMAVVFFKCTIGDSVHKVVDIYRIEDGRLAEHWDCREGNVSEYSSLNGNSVF